MKEKIRIGIIFGGRSGEHDVSLMSARSVLSVLSPDKYEITSIGITLDGDWVVGDDVLASLEKGETAGLTRVMLLPEPSDNTLYARLPSKSGQLLRPITQLDVVFPVLHGTFGEDGTLQGLLEMTGLAYVGAGVLGSSVGMDKGLFKDVMHAHAIPVLESIVVSRRQIETDLEPVMNQAEKLASYPLFIKPANLGSSVGVSKCQSRSDLMEGLYEAARFDRRVLIERGLEKPHEIEVSVLGNDQPQVSVPGEVIPSDEFYSYRAKYIDNLSKLSIPAPLPAQVIEQIRQIALRIYKVVDCAGMARVDFLVDRNDNSIYVSEINTIPGFTQISMYPKLWEASGLSYPALIDRLVELALERKGERDRTVRKYEGDE
jgi:D-alanine-D-alanine ligase